MIDSWTSEAKMDCVYCGEGHPAIVFYDDDPLCDKCLKRAEEMPIKLELEGSLSVFCQEGGFALDGIEVGDKDLGAQIREASGIPLDEAETLDWEHAKVTVEIDGKRIPAQGFGSVGFIRQIAGSKRHREAREEDVG